MSAELGTVDKELVQPMLSVSRRIPPTRAPCCNHRNLPHR